MHFQKPRALSLSKQDWQDKFPFSRHLEKDQAYMGDALADPYQNQSKFLFFISAKIKKLFHWGKTSYNKTVIKNSKNDHS